MRKFIYDTLRINILIWICSLSQECIWKPALRCWFSSFYSVFAEFLHILYETAGKINSPQVLKETRLENTKLLLRDRLLFCEHPHCFISSREGAQQKRTLHIPRVCKQLITHHASMLPTIPAKRSLIAD